QGPEESCGEHPRERRQGEGTVRREGYLLQLSREGREGRRSGRRNPESEPAELHELQVPQEAEGRRTLLGHQERQRGNRDGFFDPCCDHRRGSLDDHQLRAELLQRRRVVSQENEDEGWGISSTPFLLRARHYYRTSAALMAASLVRVRSLAGSFAFKGGRTAGRCSCPYRVLEAHRTF